MKWIIALNIGSAALNLALLLTTGVMGWIVLHSLAIGANAVAVAFCAYAMMVQS